MLAKVVITTRISAQMSGYCSKENEAVKLTSKPTGNAHKCEPNQEIGQPIKARMKLKIYEKMQSSLITK